VPEVTGFSAHGIERQLPVETAFDNVGLTGSCDLLVNDEAPLISIDQATITLCRLADI
jgi:hypothetical protein